MSRKEAAHVNNPSPSTYGARQCVLKQVSFLRVDMTQKSMLTTAQRIFEHGNRNGRLLAWLAKGQFATTRISGWTFAVAH